MTEKITTDWQDETFKAAGLTLSHTFIAEAGWIEVLSQNVYFIFENKVSYFIA